jgi:hypothetical protein
MIRKSLEEQEGANKKRKQQKRKEAKILKAQADARMESRKLADDPKKKKPKAKAKKKKTPRKRVKKNV